MKKIELVYKEILYRAIETESKVMTQLELSRELGFSLSTINLALKKLEKSNSVKITKMNFHVTDTRKILYLWASERNIEKDVIYKTRVEMPVREIERNIPDAVYGAYSAYKFRFNDVPADYSEVYVYAKQKQLEEIKKRFPFKEGNSNLFVLGRNDNCKDYGKTDTIAQIFVDLWNLREWYASEFLKEIEKRINKLDEKNGN